MPQIGEYAATLRRSGKSVVLHQRRTPRRRLDQGLSLATVARDLRREGCLIVDPAGNVLAPAGTSYVRRGNCLEEPLDDIWADSPARSAVINNKRWLSVLS